jgi:hypothetical protein
VVTVMVSQSNYLPWKGYFDLVRRADVLVLLDNVQFTRRDWRSRNLIKTPHGVQWLTVPVRTPSGRSTSISEAEVTDSQWAQSHLRALELSYRRTPYFEQVFGLLHECLDPKEALLSNLNEQVLRALLNFMELDVEVRVSRGPVEEVDASERILGLAQRYGSTRYLSGPAARAYLDTHMFTNAGVDVDFFEYPQYPEYDQVWPPFRHDVSIVDTLFHLGPGWRSALGDSG